MPKGVWDNDNTGEKRSGAIRKGWTEERRRAMSDRQRGRKRSPETREKISEALKGRYVSGETPEQKSARMRGYRLDGSPAVGHFDMGGYRALSGQHDHPLADSDGCVTEHRKVLYDKIGSGPHLCYWGCGAVLSWGTIHGICVDHLDGDTMNNDPGNLVPSCFLCNIMRGRH